MAHLIGDAAFAALLTLHAEVDRLAAPLHARHSEQLACRRGCCACCVDGLTVFAVEAERIRRRHGALLATATPHPPGACAFLDAAGACRIYEDRPYVCRTQGLPLRWQELGEDSQPVEYRDICNLNEAVGPLEELPAAACWAIGPVEERLATLQHYCDGGVGERISLRDLFAPARANPDVDADADAEPDAGAESAE